MAHAAVEIALRRRPWLASRAAPLLVVAALGATGQGARGEASAAWTQWGGPTGDFVAPATALAAEWPAEGPPRRWERSLGEGYSGVLYEQGRLYTMYRREDREVVVALDASDGRTLWEFSYAASPRDGHVHQFGDGPRATPLIVGDRIFTVGVAGTMHCLLKVDGSKVWQRQLWQELGGNFLNHGYSSSPVAYAGNVIVLVGGKGASIVAFDQRSGEVLWKRHDFENSYSTPRIVDLDGRSRLVAFMAAEVIGLDPATGDLEWSYPHENQWRQNVSAPVMAGPQHLFLSSPHAGARGLRLDRGPQGVTVREVWSSRKVQFYHGSSVTYGDWVYGSTGTMSPAFLTAVNVRTGEVAWRDRSFAKANCVSADGRLIVLDEDGQLALATATPEALVVHSRVRLFDSPAWTPPTVVGQMLYARDQRKIVALDLGRADVKR